MVKITKTVAKRMLGDVPPEKVFWFPDRKELKNLSELEMALKQMSEETFGYHSNETKSDFSNWVRDVIGDGELAKLLQKSATRAQAAKYVGDRVAWLKSQTAIR
jgi:hypothetical protein